MSESHLATCVSDQDLRKSAKGVPGGGSRLMVGGNGSRPTPPGVPGIEPDIGIYALFLFFT